jgi:short-subunit dehydrogenase
MKLGASSRSVLTGAGSGFGRALAKALAARGGDLVVSDLDLASAEETARQCLAAGARSARAVRCDVTKVADVEALAEAAGGDVDLVVNNAGVASGGLVGDQPLADFRWTVEVDLFGVVHGCHVFVPILKRQGHGHILNVASAAGLISAPRMAAYNVSKAGVVALSETLAAELAGTGVGVTALCPTFFKTHIVDSARFVDEETRKLAEGLIARGIEADAVVKAAIAAVESGELFCVPMADGRWAWRLKRFAPGSFHRLATAAVRLAERFGPR